MLQHAWLLSSLLQPANNCHPARKLILADRSVLRCGTLLNCLPGASLDSRQQGGRLT